MFATCIFCTRHLGTNEAIEAFPVGRRLAFDAARGRLWVVCPSCDRWNLTPLEERWEAIESAERLYRDTKLRVATENIGLAKIPEGLDLVRIGKPQRPEMAAWRYGDQFGRRRRRALVGGAAAVGAAGVAGSLLLPVSGFLAGFMTVMAGMGGFAGVFGAGKGKQNALFGQRWIADGEGGHLLVTPSELMTAKLGARTASTSARADGDDAWVLRLPYKTRRESTQPRLRDMLNLPAEGEKTFEGPAALEVARHVLPLINGWGGSSRTVQDAVAELENWGGPDRAFAAAARNVSVYAAQQTFGDTGALQFFPRPVRLALEMAAHEEQERRALEGELAQLEQEWRDAEEIAAISDDMLLPGGVQARFDRLRGLLKRGD